MTRTVLVTDADRGSAIAFLRSLGARGWRVIAADSDPRSAGFRSRFAHERLLVPDPRRAPRAFAERIAEEVERRPIELVVPISDECIHPLAALRARIEPRTRLAIAAPSALATVTDKASTFALARELGVPVPATRVVRDLAAAEAAADELAWPLVLKPAVSRRYLADQDRIVASQVTFARDRSELTRRLEPLLARGETVLLQRYEPGIGVGVECLAHEGRILRAFQHRRLAEIPVTGGASAWRESVALDPVLLEHARALIGALAWTGLLMVEFKLGREPWLLEINGRVWGSLPLACQAGVDFPYLLAELLTVGELPPEPTPPYRVGVRAYNLELMLSWIAQVSLGLARHDFLPRPGRARALAGVAGLLDPTQHSDLAGGRDFAPRLAEASRIVRKFSRKLAAAKEGHA